MTAQEELDAAIDELERSLHWKMNESDGFGTDLLREHAVFVGRKARAVVIASGVEREEREAVADRTHHEMPEVAR